MPNHRPNAAPPYVTRLLYTLILIAFLAPLALYAITGASARYVQDDYCYAVHLRRYGWPNAALQAYLTDSGFSGNRFALTFFLDLAELAGPINVPVLPALMIALWLPAAYWLARGIDRTLGLGMSRLQSAALAVALVSLTLSLAPNRVQILYWRPGMFTYLAPMVALFWLAAWMASRVERAVSPWTLAGITALGVVASSFSETGAVFAGGVCALALLAALVGLRRGDRRAPSGFRLAWAGLLGSLLGMAGLILAPAARLRQTAMFPNPPPPLQIAQIALESARFFVVHTLYRVTLPTLAILGLAFCLGYLAAHERRAPLQRPWRCLAWQLVLGSAAAFFLLLCVTAPSAYAESTYPEARVLLFARLVMVAYSGLVGGWLGQAFAQLPWLARRPTWLAWLGAVPVTLTLGGLLLVQPDSLVEPAYPDLRAYLFTHPVAVAATIAAGLLLAGLLAWSSKRTGAWLPVTMFAIALLLQPAFSARTALWQLPDERMRGQMWNLRDAQIRQAAAAGQRDVTVRALDSWAQITELQDNPDNWVNHCAADYYGIGSIRAIEPILNPPLRSQP